MRYTQIIMRFSIYYFVFGVTFFYGIFFLIPKVFSQENTSDGIKTIEITDTDFNPQNLTIPLGTTVVFKNTGKKSHWPASSIHPTHDIYPEFDPRKSIMPQQSWQFTFDQVGQWRFHDHLFPTMHGTITVTSSSIPTKPKALEPITVSLLSKIRFLYLDIYFSLFPKEKYVYVAKQKIAELIEKKDYQSLAYFISLVGQEQIITYLFEQSGKGKNANCHIPAHSVGRVTFMLLGEDAFQKNITLCQSGYQHGVMAAYIFATGTENLEKRLNIVCEKANSNFAKLTCFHGVGHGLMGYFDNDLPTAIDSCLALKNTPKQNNCMVGVFMENLGAYFGDSINDHPTKWLSLTDMHFPCNAIDQTMQVQRMCYAIQAHWMRVQYKNDFKKIITTCFEVSPEIRSNCFSGMGQEAALFASRDRKKIISECKKIPDIEDYRKHCFIGGLIIILDYWGSHLGNHGYLYCDGLEDKYKGPCISMVEKRLQDIKKL